MTISQSIADFTGAVEATRARLGEAKAKIEQLQEEQRRVANAPPHTDDIVAVLMRGLHSAASDFEQQLASHLHDTFLGEDGAAANAARVDRAWNILRLEAQRPHQQVIIDRSMKGELPGLNIAVLTYFLRDRIEAEILELVDKLCPQARTGMKKADRAHAMKALDAELAGLRLQHDALNADLIAARTAVRL